MQRTKWGGIADERFEASGFFRVGQHEGVFWLVDPDGGRFLSKGVNTVRFDQDHIGGTGRVPYAEACERKYGSKQAWRTAAADRLRHWNFNTVACWADELVASAGALPLATTPIAELGASFHFHRRDQVFPDVFDRDFGAHIRDCAMRRCAPRRNDPSLLGYFIDNELYWSPDWRGGEELLTLFLNLPRQRPGCLAAIDMLQQHYRDFSQFNAVWQLPANSWEEIGNMQRIEPPFFRLPPGGLNDVLESKCNLDNPRRAAFAADCDAFLALVSESYFEQCVSAIKAADPNHLVIGSRFGYQPQPSVIAAAGRYVDVLSFNCYEFDPSGIIEAYAISDRPCLISEFAFRGDDAGLPNSSGGGPRVVNQADRARCFESYVTTALSEPNVVGYHWFEHADQPAEGRFDGEDCNYGVVTIDDEVYVELTQTMARVNAAAEHVHARAADPRERETATAAPDAITPPIR